MIADKQQRDAALDPRRSFIVQAPAGSGKTDLLVKRYIKLLSIVEKPEEILAVTFTKKAAGEMRLRVLKSLSGAADIAHRLRIQTIDAFCAALTRQTPVLARFGAQPEIVEDASELYAEAAARVFEKFDPVTERLLRHLDNNVPFAVVLLAGMLRTRDRWLGKTGAPTRADLEASLLFERNRLLQKARALYPQASEELAREVLTEKGGWRVKPRPAPSELATIPGLREALYALCSMSPAKYDERQWEALEAILALLFPALAHLKTLFGERGQADFTEFAHGAVQALGAADDPSELLLSLDQKISHILVDEFQDTSLSQFSLLEKLVAGWQPGDGRTLFLVGDPMQSIYRFREAEVGLFLRARREGLGGVPLEPLTLTTNFRSQQGIVDWVNAAFSRILPAAADEASGAIPFWPSTASHALLPGPAVEWHCFYERQSEASQVTRILRETKGKSAILVRNRAHLDEIVPALKAAGVRFRAVEIEQLGERQVVQDLYALTRALLHPADRIAWLALLRAPWCGLSLSDLALLTQDSPRELIWELLEQRLRALSPNGQARMKRVREVLAPALASRLRGALRDRVEGVWLALGGPACGSATGLEDAAIFLDELERLEDAGEVDLGALADKMARLFAQPDVEAPADAVEIMTIHKSKGLEFDTVIVPGLDRLPRAGPRPLFAWKSIADGRLLLAPIDETGAGEDATYKYVRELDREADDIEAGRLFYVAATRAKQKLHLLACAKTTEEGAAKEPVRRTLLAKIWWQAREYFRPAPATADDAPRAPLPDFLRRLPADFVLPAVPDSTMWKEQAESRAEEQIEFSWAGETARHIGTVVHRWLQRIAEDEMNGWNDGRISSLKPAFLSDLSRRGVPQADLKSSSERVAEALGRTLADERGRWLLGPQKESATELRLRTADRVTYIVDRSFRDASGELWVVDWKTSRHEGKGLEEFLDREQARYRPQLERYAAALDASRLGLYFPALAKWREWERKL